MALAHNFIQHWICSSGVWITGSRLGPRRHARRAVVQGCTPAEATERTAARRIWRTWDGEAPCAACPYDCCGLTPVWYNLHALGSARVRSLHLCARAKPLRRRLAKAPTVRLDPHAVEMPKSSACAAEAIGWPARVSATETSRAKRGLLATAIDLSEISSLLRTKALASLSPCRQLT